MRIQRDVFGRLSYASINQKVDIETALKYFLSQISFSFCHADGNICKTAKSVIIGELAGNQGDMVEPLEPDIHIFDGFYLLHVMKNLPEKYESILKYIFRYISNNRKEVHIVFNKYCI